MLVNFGYALDCGAGIGRVTKNLLLPLFEKVDMVDVVPELINKSVASTWLATSNMLIKRIWAWPVSWKRRIAFLAWSASRRVWANSLTVLILVYASVMRPVIKAEQRKDFDALANGDRHQKSR